MRANEKLIGQLFLVLSVFCILQSNAQTSVNVSCFPGDTLVDTIQHGSIMLKELAFGDMVKTLDTATGKVDYSKFIDYLHYDKSIQTEYITIRTENAYLEISDYHLIQRNADQQFVYAKELTLNDEIFVHVNDQMRVEKITKLGRKQETGAFAPLTESGTILVNNVLASCYANCQSHTLSHIAFAPLRFWHQLFSYDISNETRNFFHSYVTGVFKVFGLTPFSFIIDYY